jgi:hypothetical protein
VPTSAITVSYFGVHQAFQLALAAQELGLLDVFFCSLYDAPGKWGGVLSKLMGGERLVNRRCAGFDATAAVEIPGPLLCEKLRLLGQRQNGASLWPQSALTFDRAVARRLDRCASRLFVGVETCAAHSFARAKALGRTTVLDYPGIGAEFLDEMARQAADDLGLPPPPPSDSPAMRARKQRELELADHILVCSEFQRRLLLERGVPAERLSVVPLWADPSLWYPPPQGSPRNGGPLRVLFAGSITLRKGVPYLLRAVERCGTNCRLTLAGAPDPHLKPALLACTGPVRLLPPQTKSALRDLYWQHDVLVLPSLGDSFGFVAMEAMACGLPVIVTENCGVPVPDPAWRLPVMDSEAIARRLQFYADDRAALERDGQLAQQFAGQYTPERYRAQIKGLFRRMLGETS